jgi:hypothetical protein
MCRDGFDDGEEADTRIGGAGKGDGVRDGGSRELRAIQWDEDVTIHGALLSLCKRIWHEQRAKGV